MQLLLISCHDNKLFIFTELGNIIVVIVTNPKSILPWVHEKFTVKFTMLNVDGYTTIYMHIGCLNCPEYTSRTTTHPVQLHIPYNYTSRTTTHPVQLHIPTPVQLHVVQLLIPYNYTSHTTTHPVQLLIPYNYTSRTTTYPVQLHILYTATYYYHYHTHQVLF